MFIERPAFAFLVPITPADAVYGRQALFCLDSDHRRLYKGGPESHYFRPMQPEPRTAAQLTGAPLAADVEHASGFGFYLDTDPSQLFRVAAGGAAYEQVAGAPASTVESANRALSVLDSNAILTCASAITFTVPKLLRSNFRPTFIGAGVVTVSGASGVTVSDFRASGSAHPQASLVQLAAADTYALTGTKA